MDAEEIRRATGKDPDNPTIIWRSRMHVLGAAIYRHVETGNALLDVWCDCGWTGEPTQLDQYPQTFEDIPDTVIAEAVQPWREHLRISGRMFRMHTRLTKIEKQAERSKAQVTASG